MKGCYQPMCYNQDLKHIPPTYRFSVLKPFIILQISSVTTMSMPYLIHKKNLSCKYNCFTRFNITAYNCVH